MVDSQSNKSTINKSNHQAILYICAHSPTKLYPQAGQKIAWHNLRKYAINNNDNVDIVIIANKAEIDTAQDLITEYGDRLYPYPLSKLNKIKSCLSNLHIPLKFATRSHKQAARQIRLLLSANNYDIIHFEYSHAAVYLDFILDLETFAVFKNHRKFFNSQNLNFSNNLLVKRVVEEEEKEEERKKEKNIYQKTKVIISIHDIISQSFLRKAESQSLLGIEVARLFAYEKKIYNLADELWVLSNKDRDILTSLFSVPAHRIIVTPPPLSDFVYKINRKPDKIEPLSILFWGAMDRPENEQAVIEFVDQCFHKLVQKNPKYKLYIVGSKPSQKVLSLQSQDIIVTGFIKDPTPFFEKAAIGVVPLLTGAGLKLKTLEMLQAGLPVISTSVGAEGVTQNENLFVNDKLGEWDEFLSWNYL
ncbi:MAG: glycosyltransferase [Mastigocoleus sp.]